MEDKQPHRSLPQPPEGCSANVLRELRERTQAAMAAQRERMEKLEQSLTSQLEEITASLAEQLVTHTAEAQQADQTYENAQRLRQELQEAQDAWHREQEEINSANTERQHELDQHHAELDERAGQLDKRDSELAEREQSLTSTQLEIENERENFSGQRAEWDKAKAALESEQKELQHKFDLALDDVRRLRGRVAELEQDLASRPDADEGDAADLVHLRAERDALVERIEELEQQPAAEVDADTQRQLADLQRRFELAVEDVRELKTLNAKLEARLAEAEQSSASKANSGDMGWEAQKQRILDSLAEDFSDIDDPVVRRERATIEGTVRITDDVVAKKDDEIAMLKEEIANLKSGAADHPEGEASHDAKVDRIVDADEVVQQHRQKLAQLEKEMEEKLRTAELELSVERAKIARKQVELNDWRAELESMQQTRGTDDGGSSGTPKRRWLAKLGLGGEDEES